MAQVLFATDPTCANADLDANFNELYRFRELVSTPAHGAYSAYTASNEKGAIDATTFSWNWKIGDIKNSGTGNIVVTGSGKVGYDTGAGGTVTQITSKSTAVTLNKACGEITMNGAALAAGVVVAFPVNNSLLSSVDRVVANLKTGYATIGTYNVWAESVAAGQFYVCVRNISAGSLSESLVIGFAIIKGVNA